MFLVPFQKKGWTIDHHVSNLRTRGFLFQGVQVHPELIRISSGPNILRSCFLHCLSPCEFATCMRALIPCTVTACLHLLPGPSLTLSPSEFESYMRALTPTPVPPDFPCGNKGESLSLRHPLLLTTPPRAFPRPLLLTTPRVLEYSDDIVFLSHPPHSVFHVPAPLPDNSIIIATVVSMWMVFFM